MNLLAPLAKLINKLLPFEEDAKARAGWAWVKLNPAHPFNRAAIQHDYYADRQHAGTPEVSQAKADLELFRDMAILVNGKALVDEKAAIELAHQACAFWPIARKFGKIRELGT